MKNLKLFLVLIIIMISQNLLKAQLEDIDIDDLQTPTSPAFKIIDIEPSSIQRPTTPKAVVSDIKSLFENGEINPGGAVEFAPYWLRNRPTMTFQQFVDPTFWQSLQKSSSISIGTGNLISDNNTIGGKLGIGLRTVLFQGDCKKVAGLILANNQLMLQISDWDSPDPLANHGETILDTKLKKCESVNSAWLPTHFIRDTIIGDLNRAIRQAGIEPAKNDPLRKDILLGDMYVNEVFTEAIAYMQADLGSDYFDREDTAKSAIKKQMVKDALLRYQAYYSEFFDSLLEEYADCMDNPPGFSMDLATAIGINAPDDEDPEYYQSGLWTNLSYKGQSSNFSFTFLLRYLNRNLLDTVANMGDLGLELNWEVDINEEQNRKFSVGVEGVARYFSSSYKDSTDKEFSDSQFDYKAAVNARFDINKYVALTFDVGKNFNTNRWFQGSFLSTIGVEIGFPTKQKFSGEELRNYGNSVPGLF